ncbi:MAG: MoaD/ThiS family protein, partial [Pyrinomonadaceae bacterium]
MMPRNRSTEDLHPNSNSRISIRVLFFGAAREAAQCSETKIEIQAPATVASTFENIQLIFPALKEFTGSLLLAVNMEYREMNSPVLDGDELAIFPPVSGGSS